MQCQLRKREKFDANNISVPTLSLSSSIEALLFFLQPLSFGDLPLHVGAVPLTSELCVAFQGRSLPTFSTYVNSSVYEVSRRTRNKDMHIILRLQETHQKQI